VKKISLNWLEFKKIWPVRFYKPKTEKTEPKPEKTEPNRKKPIQTEKTKLKKPDLILK
jgi:hypothetical protein